jgi:hypothetical protein
MNPSVTETVDATLQVGWNPPLWLLMLAAVAFVSFAGWIYWRERGTAPLGLRFGLAVIRALLLMMVLWMILGWHWQKKRVENPELIIAVDVSESMRTPDSGLSSAETASGVTRLDRVQKLLALNTNQLRQLEKRYRLRFYFVAQEASFTDLDWQDLNPLQWSPEQNSDLQIDQSRLGDALIRIVERQAGRSAAAMVFFSDGIVTSGKSLEQAGGRAAQASIPVHAIAVGQQFTQPDIRITDLLAEDQVFLGDRVNLEATIASSDIRDSSVTVQLINASTGKIFDTQKISLGTSEPQASVMLGYTPDQPGETLLEVFVQEYPGELNTGNNRAQWKLNVLDREIRVMLAFEQPSYEFRYLKHFLERSAREDQQSQSRFLLSSVLQSGDLDYVAQDSAAARFIPTRSDQLSEFDVFIIGSVDPSMIPASTQQGLVQSVIEGGAGCVFVVSSPQELKRLSDSNLGVLLPIESISDEAVVDGGVSILVTKMGEAILPFDMKTRFDNGRPGDDLLPMLSKTLPVATLKSGAQSLIESVSQRDGQRKPLLISQFGGAGRSAALATDETYRWSSLYGSDLLYQQFWGQLIRWLSRGRLQSDSDGQLTVEPKNAKAGAVIQLKLKLNPKSGSHDSVQVKIAGPEDFERTVGLSRVAGSAAVFQGAVDALFPGTYRASLVQPALPNPPAAEFSVVAPLSEQANLQVDVDAMKMLAEASQGKFWLAEETPQWIDHLPPGNPVLLGNLPDEPIWNHFWVALLFVSLISLEWLLRRAARML